MLNYFEELSKKYNISLENIISIALNRYGILMEDTDDNRLRFNLKILNNDKDTFFAVCVNTHEKSPFILKDKALYLENEKIGEVSNIERDTCTSTYFRNNKKVITFNSNARSKCVGCKFCGTYSLTDEDSNDFSTKENIKDYFNDLLKQNNIKSMNDIENVTICTGCFNNEDELIDHLLLVNESFKDMSFNGSINYIGSQLRDYKKIRMVANEINDFGIYLSLEKFLDRHKYMIPEKASLSIEEAKDLLQYSSSLGITTTFLYILGLEDLKTIKKYFEYLKDSVNKFPIIQIFQNYTKQQEKYRCEEAKDVEYYIKARKILDDTFKNKNLNPKLWECFRSLYFENDKKNKELIKCNKKI